MGDLLDPNKAYATHDTDPVAYYNNHQRSHAETLLRDLGWEIDEDGQWIIDHTDLAAQWDDTGFVIDTVKCPQLNRSCRYTPFQILVQLKFGGDWRAATEWVILTYLEEDIPFIRVGVDYFKRITKNDRFGIPRTELKHWTMETIKQDFNRKYLDRVPHFDDFTIIPDNFNYKPVHGNCYNLYQEFTHKPVEGKWKWSNILMEHVFGDQYDIGMRYLQCLYLHPCRLMPILVLVSRERQTGKTTFLNWLNMIFGANVAAVSPDDLINGFNSAYAASNIITVDETLFEKKITVEKLKALATAKFITVNQKFVSQYRMPFFGKIILASNNEDKFARIDQEEIRFFVRKLPEPKVYNHDIEKNLISEIPAFLHYLTTLPPIDFSVDRTGFKPQELNNQYLQLVKQESRDTLSKELIIKFTDLFLNELSHLDEFKVDAASVKERFYPYNHNIGAHYIFTTMRDDVGLEFIKCDTSDHIHIFGGNDYKTVKNYFVLRREQFTNEPSKSNEIPF